MIPTLVSYSPNTAKTVGRVLDKLTPEKTNFITGTENSDYAKRFVTGSLLSAGIIAIANSIKGNPLKYDKVLRIPAILASGVLGATLPAVVNLTIAKKRKLIDGNTANRARERILTGNTIDSFKASKAAEELLLKTSGWKRKLITGGVVLGTGGTLYAGSQLKKLNNRPSSRSNYTTFLRNNIVSGRMGPRNIGRTDLSNVKRLGMR